MIAQTTATDASLWPIIAMLGLALLAVIMLLVRVRQSVRRMTTEHDRLLRSLSRRSDELEAALSSMVDAVLAVDIHGQIVSANDAAARLLDLKRDPESPPSVGNAIAAEPLRTFITQSLDTRHVIVSDIELPPLKSGGEMRMFQATGSVLRHRGEPRIGSLIVLHDVTRLRRLEVVRRDFVSNASHEIRTPVAAIKMAAETLTDGGPVEGESLAKFLGIIARQADRLQALIDDLLSLARIERDTEEQRIKLEKRPLAGVLRSAVETCQTAARPRNTRIELDCPEDLYAPIHPPLLEQAVVNLIDNAIKYSPDGSLVRCRAHRFNGEVIVSVIDTGAGIDAEHLPRIFERFYRTDKARGRDLGGTGLGLAIVKNIAAAHGGRVSVDSRPGAGSTFRVHLQTG